MNKRAQEIVSELLSLDEAWDKKTRKLRFDWVVDTYADVLTSRFYDEVLFPKMIRAFRLMIALGFACEDQFESVSLGYHAEIPGIWAKNPDLVDLVSNRFSGEYVALCNGRFRDSYIGRWWNSPEWAYQELSEEDILSLGIRPTIVPAKVLSGGAVQPSMI